MPELTITSYTPATGAAPLRVHAVAAITSGTFDLLTWLCRLNGGPWQVAAINPATDLDHTYTFAEPGTWEIKLTGQGSDGEAETGRQRLVEVQSAVPAPTPPPSSIALPTYAQFLELEGPQVDDAYRTLGADRPTTGDVRHTAWRRLVEGWSHAAILADVAPTLPAPNPTPAPTDVPGAHGIVRLMGERAVGDEDGAKLYVGLSRFYWLWAWKHDRDRVLREMDMDRAVGYRYVRVLAQVQNMGSDHYWDGREVDPEWPDHQELVASLTRAAAERGLLLLWTLVGKGGPMDRQGARRPFVRRTSTVLRDCMAGVLIQEMVNEPGGYLSREDLLELWHVAKEAAPALPTATGAVWTDEAATGFDGEAWAATQREVGICHLDRSRPSGEPDRPWRQPWDVGLQSMPWIDNEPIGPGASVASESRPDVLRSHRAVAFICRAFASCFHADAGIRGLVPMEGTPGYAEAPHAIRFLPGDLVNGWQHNANTNYPGRPFNLPDQYVRSVSGKGIVRCYSCRAPDGTYYTIPFGPVSPYELQTVRDLHVECYQQDVNDRLWAGDFRTGQMLAFPNPAVDYVLVSRPL